MAFRAGGYNPEQTARYTTKLKEKIAQGLAIGGELKDTVHEDTGRRR